MKLSIITTYSILLSILLCGCDPAYQVDYKVVNYSGGSIKIVADYNGTGSDTNIISAGTTLIFYNDFGIGVSTSDYLDKLKTLPVGLSIFNKSGLPYNKSEEDLSNWNIYYPEKKSEGIGAVQLTVRAEDFD